MKKITTVALLVLAGAMACSSAFAGNGTTSGSEVQTLQRIATHNAKPKAKSVAGKKKFLYLDMVQRKPSPSIRNAVIVYEHLQLKKQACNPNDGKSVSECLHSPSV